VKEHHFLVGPVDLDMDTGLDPAGAEQVRRIMEEVQPDIVLTFGPEGMTGHVAHQDVSRWAGEAFGEVAKPGARLFHAVFPRSLGDEWLEKLAPFNIFRPGTPHVVADEELDQKVASIKEHASQIEALYEVFGDEGFRRFMAKEGFVLAATKEF
jgi:LmbE family N-acetylglucosaminyl deacetylase